MEVKQRVTHVSERPAGHAATGNAAAEERKGFRTELEKSVTHVSERSNGAASKDVRGGP